MVQLGEQIWAWMNFECTRDCLPHHMLAIQGVETVYVESSHVCSQYGDCPYD